tara:strand:- start:237 stop:1064 length:828 start_codon:yes stop_codon:yes gene_type:complete
MVCHETYQDETGNWYDPEEVLTNNGEDYLLKKDQNIKIKVGPSESMSKSKKNTINPERIINIYGADAVRFFILSDSPPEKDVQWSDSGMLSSYKFIQKFWLLNKQIVKSIEDKEIEMHNEIEIFTNQSINKINFALEKFRYNVIIAIYHEIYAFFKKISDKKKNYKNLKKNYEKIILVMMPVLPHLSSECLRTLNFNDEVKWPQVDMAYILEEENEIVIQVNGKKRSIILVKKDTPEKEIVEKIKDNKLIDKYINEKKLIKKIYIKNRLINYIIS